jgi:hypothetical protein
MVVVRVAVELCYRIHWVLRDADLRLRRWPVSSRAFLIFLIALHLNILGDSAI